MPVPAWITGKLFPREVLFGVLVLGSSAIPHSHAQTASAFEVASVKLNPPASSGYTSVNFLGLDRFTATNISFPNLMEMAFEVDDYQLLQKPSWFDTASYSISTKPEGETSLTYQQLKPLLQQLLAQRFHLKVHHETRYVKGYTLVVAKDGPKLQTSKGDAAHVNILPEGIQGRNLSLQVLAGVLSRPTGRPVVDKTGIQGNYDIKLDYAATEAMESSLPSVFTALTEQLGLKLEPQEVPVDMVMIDHVDKEPTEN